MRCADGDGAGGCLRTSALGAHGRTHGAAPSGREPSGHPARRPVACGRAAGLAAESLDAYERHLRLEVNRSAAHGPRLRRRRGRAARSPARLGGRAWPTSIWPCCAAGWRSCAIAAPPAPRWPGGRPRCAPSPPGRTGPGCIDADPGALLASPRAHRTLPPVLDAGRGRRGDGRRRARSGHRRSAGATG